MEDWRLEHVDPQAMYEELLRVKRTLNELESALRDGAKYLPSLMQLADFAKKGVEK